MRKVIKEAEEGESNLAQRVPTLSSLSLLCVCVCGRSQNTCDNSIELFLEEREKRLKISRRLSFPRVSSQALPIEYVFSFFSQRDESDLKKQMLATKVCMMRLEKTFNNFFRENQEGELFFSVEGGDKR